MIYITYYTKKSIFYSYTPLFFFFKETAPTQIYTLSLHDALPISGRRLDGGDLRLGEGRGYNPQIWRRNWFCVLTSPPKGRHRRVYRRARLRTDLVPPGLQQCHRGCETRRNPSRS